MQEAKWFWKIKAGCYQKSIWGRQNGIILEFKSERSSCCTKSMEAYDLNIEILTYKCSVSVPKHILSPILFGDCAALICLWQICFVAASSLFHWSYFDLSSVVKGQTWVMKSIACSDCSVDLLTWVLSTSDSGSVEWQVEVTTVSGAPSLTALWGMLHQHKRMPGRGP